jgi:AAA15 family ATPase/GTPase
VPYIRDIQSDRVLSYQTLRFLEEDSGSEFQLAQMSDGTIRLLGLLTILRQPVPPAVVVIEEPENALHMHAVQSFLQVARRVAMADDFASQVFMTSHSPAVVDEMLSLDAMRETDGQTACFVTQRKSGQPNIVQAPASVMKAIADNLGRPSDFQREGSFGDEPTQLPLTLNEAEAA